MTMDLAKNGGKEPYRILGLSSGASDEEIRAAYLRKIKEYPPDRNPEQFESVRDAYRALCDPRQRARLIIEGSDPCAPLVELLDARKSRAAFVGPKPWLEAIRKLANNKDTK
jgi:curved DNA-binding protein CbpA